MNSMCQHKKSLSFFFQHQIVKPVMLDYSEELHRKNIGIILRRPPDEGFFKRIVTHLYFWIFAAAMHIIHVFMCYEVCAIIINIIYNKCIYYHKNIMCVTSCLGSRRITRNFVTVAHVKQKVAMVSCVSLSVG